MAKNLPAQQAEHDAVVRFGSPARVARQLRRAHRGAGFNSDFSSVWLPAGLGLAGLGVSYLAAAASIAVELWTHPERVPTCAENLHRVCTDSVPVMRRAIVAGLVVLVLGVVVLLGRRLAMRFARLAPAVRRFPPLAALLFALAGLALFAEPFITPGAGGFAPQSAPAILAIPQGPGPPGTSHRQRGGAGSRQRHHRRGPDSGSPAQIPVVGTTRAARAEDRRCCHARARKRSRSDQFLPPVPGPRPPARRALFAH